MAKRRMGIIMLFLCLCLLLVPCQALAASTTGAAEPIETEKTCSIDLYYGYDGTAFADVSVKLYKIANVSADFQYTLTSNFEGLGLVLNGIQTVGEWNVLRSTLEAAIIADRIKEDFVAVTDDTGRVLFESLETGLYLATVEQAVNGDVKCSFDSALISLPDLGENGLWQYQVSAVSKGEIIKPDEPEKEVQYKVVKLWRGDSGEIQRPESVEAEIFCDGVSYKTVILSEENRWIYSWSAKDDGAKWTVAERDIPTGYTVTVEEHNTSFILTNTYAEETPDKPTTPSPETGDTSNIMLYTVLMCVSGIMLIILAAAGKRKRT